MNNSLMSTVVAYLSHNKSSDAAYDTVRSISSIFASRENLPNLLSLHLPYAFTAAFIAAAAPSVLIISK